MSTLPEEITRHFGTNLAKPTFLGHAFRIVDDSEEDCRRCTLELLIPGKGWQSWMALDEDRLFRETYEAYEHGKIPPALTAEETKTLLFHGFSFEFSEGEVYAECVASGRAAQLSKTCTGWKWLRGAEKAEAESLEDAIAAVTVYQEQNQLPEERLLAALVDTDESKIERLLNPDEHAA